MCGAFQHALCSARYHNWLSVKIFLCNVRALPCVLTANTLWPGAGGFAYAARTMGLCAAPAVACMLLGGGGAPGADAELAAVWAGLVTLMGARAAAIALPYWARRPPFARLFEDLGA